MELVDHLDYQRGGLERMSMKNPVYPGAVIREDFLKEFGISVSDVSRKLRCLELPSRGF